MRKHWEMLKPWIPLVRADSITEYILPSFPRSHIPKQLPSPNSNQTVLMPPHCPVERKADLNSDYDDLHYPAVRRVLAAQWLY